MKNVRGIIEDGVFVGIFIFIMMLSLYTPIGLITIYFLPIPFIIYGYRNGMKKGLWIMLINALLALMFGSYLGVFLAIIASSIGLVMGSLYKKEELLPAIVGGVITAIINLIGALFISKYIFDFDFITNIKSMSLSYMENMQYVLSHFENQQQSEQVIEDYQHFLSSIEQLLPFIFISLALFIVFINHIIAKQVLIRMGIKIPSFLPFRNWKFPKSIIYYYIFTVLFILFGPMTEMDTFKIVIINLYPVLQFILLIQGLSFIFYFFYHKKKSKAFPIIITIVSILIPFLSQLINMIGILDIGFNIRKKIKI